MNQQPKPRWWRLYAILPLMLGALLYQARLGLSAWEHRIAQLVILGASFGLVWLWLKANETALWLSEYPPKPLRREKLGTRRSHPLPPTEEEMRRNEPKHAPEFDATHRGDGN